MARGRRYPASTITDGDYANDALTRAETLRHSLEKASESVRLHVNANKTEYISKPNKRHLYPNRWFVETSGQIHLPRSSVSSTENDNITRLANTWSAIDRLSVIWKSDQSNKIKRNFSKHRSCPYYCLKVPYGRWRKGWRAHGEMA